MNLIFLIWSWWIGCENQLLTSNPITQKNKVDLTIEIENAKNERGKFLVLLFSTAEGFPGDSRQSVFSGDFPVSKTIVIADLPLGRYALSIVHDENGDGKLKTNWLGIPQEGYSFSNAKGKLLERPDFQKALFTHGGKMPLKVRLIY